MTETTLASLRTACTLCLTRSLRLASCLLCGDDQRRYEQEPADLQELIR